MDRNRKILISILALLVLSSVIAIVDISMNMQQKRGAGVSFRGPQMGSGVGIVRIEGAIQMIGSTTPLSMTQGAEGIIRRLDDLEHNSDIKAVVVRINSPGGTVGASQEIYQKLWKLRKKNIPLVASMGEIAASGGYYVASACNYIVANHGTLTGSIGVIAMSPNLRGLFQKIGIDMNVIKSGKYKDILSSFRDIRPEERELIQEIIDSSYHKFLKDVALGRNQNESDIQPIADGRVMSGETALKYKLVDMLGTFEDAIDKARQLAKLPEDSAVYEEMKSPFEQMFFRMEGMLRGGNIMEQGLRSLEQENNYRIEYRCLP
ncbi:MAG TPA: signal peptide peptidase SppA [Spirochaetota bacterium]|nr:signal peptide peptidase SppA [Spirochaetota bacterium]HPC40720.1 signal peptide peptidase SppA [Spirochaetota bacterium]HPL18937.1 signal peptide peptidase SppA [Spirochaetota bacterium]HQF09371.1 signal peptide peptidase SppA [Spirochaetota bacterium]HQH98015.1 signal peptide peptidase SppA [Spirochaetota bacterium]